MRHTIEPERPAGKAVGHLLDLEHGSRPELWLEPGAQRGALPARLVETLERDADAVRAAAGVRRAGSHVQTVVGDGPSGRLPPKKSFEGRSDSGAEALPAAASPATTKVSIGAAASTVSSASTSRP